MSIYKNFSGSIDDLLKHVSTEQSLSSVDNEKTLLNDEEMIDCIVEDCHCSKDEAREILLEIKTEEVTKTFYKFVELGLAEIVSYEDGLPIIELTALGRIVQAELRKNS